MSRIERQFDDALASVSSKRYEEWKADGIARAARLQTLYEDKVTVHFNDSPSEAKFFVTIGLHMEGDVIRLLDFAKAQGLLGAETSKDEESPYKCEGGSDCTHTIPNGVYEQLHSWIVDREADFWIAHQECIGDGVVLKHEGVWCVVGNDPE